MNAKVLIGLGNILEAIFSPKILAECGHYTREKDMLSAFGQTKHFHLPIEHGTTPYCHRCLSAMTIRCALCGKPIYVGDKVVIGQSADMEDTHKPGYTVCHGGGLIYAICTRSSCVELAGIAEAGIWVPPGVIRLNSWHRTVGR